MARTEPSADGPALPLTRRQIERVRAEGALDQPATCLREGVDEVVAARRNRRRRCGALVGLLALGAAAAPPARRLVLR